MQYNHNYVEKKWQKYWEENNTFYTDVYDFSKPKYYALDMFPYPSGQGLHVGHPRGYTASDVISRMKRMQGYNVLHPMGYDSFGLPAEQYAIQTRNHPGDFTKDNIKTFTRQLKMLGFSFDWSKQISTADPEFYKWTQWIFLQFFNDKLAKQIDTQVNWCEQLKTVLANDEIIDGKSERGGYPVVKKNMKQWILDIPKYAEKLLEGLDNLDWPESTKEMQRNWIGKSVGANITFKVKDHDVEFVVFTTRPDTLFGATYCVLSPENKLVNLITTKEKFAKVSDYKKMCELKSEQERLDTTKEKTGIFTGAYAINPVNNKLLPIYIADYVLATYATGAIMAVPAHDSRDYAFAKKFNLEIISVIEGADVSSEAFEGDGLHTNSDFINGLNKEAAILKMINYLEENKMGYAKTIYKLREWIFARQRYWGEPIPVVHHHDEVVAIPYDQLPLVLPEMQDYKPQVGKLAPLDNATSWVNYEGGLRETSTMPGSAGSSWYFLRYLDPNNEKEMADKKLLDHWLPVDLYIGGSEHAVGHLLYSRFWMNYLYDKGIVNTKEPFKKLFHQGMILGENNEKMSKSKGNVINPDPIIEDLGADSLRLYEMFMGPLEASLPWSTTGLEGSKKFLDRVWRLYTSQEYTKKVTKEYDDSLEMVYHQTVKKVTNDIESLNLNTAIAQMMIFINEAYKAPKIYVGFLEGFVKMLSCYAPHMAEEIWQLLGKNKTITYAKWPKYDEKLTISNTVDIVIQVNGKLRDKIQLPLNTSKDDILKKALNSDKVKSFIEGKDLIKTIIIPNKLVNIVIKQ